nr:transposase (putative), gypsy type [Tanacetum cinerariifolium]
MEFNADDYAVLVSHPASFRKFPGPFFCLIGISRYYTLDEDTHPTFLRDDETEIDLFAFIQVADPTKVKVGERERAEGEARLLDSTVGRVVPLLPVAPARTESELEASVERLFDEGASADQVDSAAGGGQEAEVGIAMGVRIVVEENGGYGASSEASICGKSPPVLRELLESSPLNVEVGVAAVLTLPMVTSLVSATPEHGSGDPADSITRLNVCTIGASERFVISSDSSHHSTTHASEAEGDSIIGSDVVPLVTTEAVVTSHAVNIPPVLEIDTAGPFYSVKQDLSMGSQELNSETLHQVFVPQWNLLDDSLLDDYDVSCEFVDHLAPPALFFQIHEMNYHHLFTEFNVGTTRQACLNVEVRMRTVYCLSERKRLESECEKQADLLKDLELKELNVVVSSLRSQKDGLVNQVHELEVTCFGLRERLSGYENLTDRLEEFQDAQLKVVNDKVAKLDADLAEMACYLEDKFYPHLLTTISGQRWLLTHGLKLVLIKCLNSSEYLTALRASISCSIEKGMQDGLAARIDHGREGRILTDVAAYNPSAEADFNSALQELRPLADAPGMSDLQPDIEQLKVPIHSLRTSVPAATITTMTLSTTFASASSIPPITVNDYEIVHADGHESPQGNVQGDAATVELQHVGTKEQVADIFTKPLHREAFVKLREKLRICSLKDKQDISV